MAVVERGGVAIVERRWWTVELKKAELKTVVILFILTYRLPTNIVKLFYDLFMCQEREPATRKYEVITLMHGKLDSGARISTRWC